MKYILETKVVNTFVRAGQLRKNMTNLPMRWKSVASSDNLAALQEMKSAEDRIIDRATGEEV